LDAFELENGIPTIDKTPSEVLDYSFDFSEEMAKVPDDAVNGHSVTSKGTAVLGDVIRDGSLVTFWLSVGRAGYTTAVDCTVTTLAGRKITRSLNVAVVARK
jgi:hypothetical protein